MAVHIEEGYEKKGVSKKEAQARAWATVNKDTGVAKKAEADQRLQQPRKKHSQTFEATIDGVELDLLPKEFALLEFFMRNPDKVFNADAVMRRVWKSDS